MMKTDHTVAELEFLDAAPGLYHRARKFVAEDLRRLDEAVVNLFDVRAANAARGHAEKHFAFANLWDGHRFDHHAPLAAIHTRAHLAAVLRSGAVRSDLCNRLAHRFDPAVAAALSKSSARPAMAAI